MSESTAKIGVVKYVVPKMKMQKYLGRMVQTIDFSNDRFLREMMQSSRQFFRLTYI
jgi:hypothetical protein